MRETLVLWLKRAAPAAAALWLFGVLSLAFDARYSNNEFVASAVFPPYALYIGGKELVLLAPLVVERLKSDAQDGEPPAVGDADEEPGPADAGRWLRRAAPAR